MITVSRDSLAYRMASDFKMMEPETGCEFVIGVIGYAIRWIIWRAVILAILWFVSLPFVGWAVVGNANVPLDRSLMDLLPYQGAILAAGFALFKTAYWLCGRIKFV